MDGWFGRVIDDASTIDLRAASDESVDARDKSHDDRWRLRSSVSRCRKSVLSRRCCESVVVQFLRPRPLAVRRIFSRRFRADSTIARSIGPIPPTDRVHFPTLHPPRVLLCSSQFDLIDDENVRRRR
uniref:Uncharacterized protein n=1 Tax=Plectus sambesii TaxID=2011161 RepID=A0A914WU59_9BILA